MRLSDKTMNIRNFLPAIVLLGALVAAYFLGFFKYLDFKFVKDNYVLIDDFARNHKFLSALIFVGVYSFACAIGTPSLMALSLGSGAFFGGFVGGLYSAIGATIGSVVLFWVSNKAIGNFSKPKDTNLFSKMRTALAKHEFMNLLAFRLIPIAPLFIISIGAAGLGVRLKNFVAATFLGLLCVETSFAFLGANLETKLRTGGIGDWQSFITPGIILPFVAMSAFAILSNIINSRKI